MTNLKDEIKILKYETITVEGPNGEYEEERPLYGIKVSSEPYIAKCKDLEFNGGENIISYNMPAIMIPTSMVRLNNMGKYNLDPTVNLKYEKGMQDVLIVKAKDPTMPDLVVGKAIVAGIITKAEIKTSKDKSFITATLFDGANHFNFSTYDLDKYKDLLLNEAKLENVAKTPIGLTFRFKVKGNLENPDIKYLNSYFDNISEVTSQFYEIYKSVCEDIRNQYVIIGGEVSEEESSVLSDDDMDIDYDSDNLSDTDESIDSEYLEYVMDALKNNDGFLSLEDLDILAANDNFPAGHFSTLIKSRYFGVNVYFKYDAELNTIESL